MRYKKGILMERATQESSVDEIDFGKRNRPLTCPSGELLG